MDTTTNGERDPEDLASRITEMVQEVIEAYVERGGQPAEMRKMLMDLYRMFPTHIRAAVQGIVIETTRESVVDPTMMELGIRGKPVEDEDLKNQLVGAAQLWAYAHWLANHLSLVSPAFESEVAVLQVLSTNAMRYIDEQMPVPAGVGDLGDA